MACDISGKNLTSGFCIESNSTPNHSLSHRPRVKNIRILTLRSPSTAFWKHLILELSLLVSFEVLVFDTGCGIASSSTRFGNGPIPIHITFKKVGFCTSSSDSSCLPACRWPQICAIFRQFMEFVSQPKLLIVPKPFHATFQFLSKPVVSTRR